MIEPRKALGNLETYRPGRPAALGGRGPLINLAANENAWGPSPKVVQGLDPAAWARYPDMGGESLVAPVAAHLGVSPAHVLLGTGSGHLIKCLAETYLGPGDTAVTVFPTFSLYAHDTHLMGAAAAVLPGDGHQVAWTALPAFTGSRAPRLVFLCSPNNPTGETVPMAVLDALLDALPSASLLVVDEAYVHFAERDPGLPSRVVADHRLAVLRTFSKAYGLAALRLGVLVAPPPVIQAVGKVREPFPVSGVALESARIALDDEAHLRRVVEAVSSGRRRLARDLGVRGWSVVAGEANFVWARPPGAGPSATVLHEGLLAQGVLVRAGSGFGVPDHLRITVGRVEEMDRLLRALDEITEPSGRKAPRRHD